MIWCFNDDLFAAGPVRHAPCQFSVVALKRTPEKREEHR